MKPESATHEWKAAKEQLGQRRWYRFNTTDNQWECYFQTFKMWFYSISEDSWFTNEISQGYFVALPKDPTLDSE